MDAARMFAGAHRQLPAKRCIFFGHSLGALLAFETVRELSRMGIPGPERLIVSGRQSPDWPDPSYSLPDPSDDGIRRYLLDLGGTPQAIFENEDLLQMIVPVMRSDLDLIRTYRFVPSPRLSIPIDAIGGISDPTTPFESLPRWRAMTAGPVRIHIVEGGHFAAIAEPSIVFRIAGLSAARAASLPLETCEAP
jgi:medium-chain acyl-[acyl-carrier-protein] hydrolase